MGTRSEHFYTFDTPDIAIKPLARWDDGTLVEVYKVIHSHGHKWALVQVIEDAPDGVKRGWVPEEQVACGTHG
jgi:hypothetical protein